MSNWQLWQSCDVAQLHPVHIGGDQGSPLLPPPQPPAPAPLGGLTMSPPSWTCPEKLHREASKRHLNQMPKPSQMGSFNTKALYSELLPDIQLSWLRVNPATLWGKLILAACISDLILQSLPRAHDYMLRLGWKLTCKLGALLKAQLFLHHDSLVEHLHYCLHFTSPTVELILTLTCEQAQDTEFFYLVETYSNPLF